MGFCFFSTDFVVVAAMMWLAGSSQKGMLLPVAALTDVNLPLPFGPDVGDVSTAPTDNGSSVPFTLNPPLKFYGALMGQVYQNANGYVTFDGPYSLPMPFELPRPYIPAMIAAFWCDVNTLNGGSLYSRTTNDTVDLELANLIVNNTGLTENATFSGTNAFVATWYDVAPNLDPNLQSTDRVTNTFQLTIVYDTQQTWALLSYKRLKFFTTGDPSTVVGFNGRYGQAGATIAMVGTRPDAHFLKTETNCGVNGTFAFRVDYANEVVVSNGGMWASVSDSPTQSPTQYPTPSDFSEMPSMVPSSYTIELPSVWPITKLALAFGTTVGDSDLGPTDDGSTQAIPLPMPMQFLGVSVNQIYQNANGILTFDQPYDIYSGIELPAGFYPALAAAYWMDIQTLEGGDIYSRVTMDPLDLDDADLVVRASGLTTRFHAATAFVGTWDNVGRYHGGDSTDLRNTFQVTLAFNAVETWGIFSYSKLEFFDTPSASQTTIGYNSFDGGHGIQVAGLVTNAMMQAFLLGTNCGIEGTYVYRIDSIPTNTTV